MNEVLKTLYDRKSVRVFEDRPVPEEVRQQIRRAAFEAPTAGNQMLYSILDITDPALKARLGEAEALRAEGRATLPTRVDIELETNVFLRANEPAVREGVNMLVAPDWKVFAEVRERKNRA